MDETLVKVLTDIKELQDLLEPVDPHIIIMSTVQSMYRTVAKYPATIRLKEAVNNRQISDNDLRNFIESVMKEHFQPGFLCYYEYILFAYIIALKDRYMQADSFAQEFVNDLANLNCTEIYYAINSARILVTEFHENLKVK